MSKVDVFWIMISGFWEISVLFEFFREIHLDVSVDPGHQKIAIPIVMCIRSADYFHRKYREVVNVRGLRKKSESE